MTLDKKLYYYFLILIIFVLQACTWIMIQTGAVFSPDHFSFFNSDPAHATTNNRATMKLEDAPIGTSIQIGSKTFIKIAANQYMQKAPICHTRVWDFDYTGTEQTWTAPVDGTYKLEVWGAQGGNGLPVPDVSPEYDGGYGGYAVGIYDATANTKLYVNVGGNGSYRYNNEQRTTLQIDESYNGGGAAMGTYLYHWTTASGGGATHIAEVSGELKNLSAYKDTGGENNSNEILIVAGGGGGASSYYCERVTDRYLDYHASGGGYIGRTATRINYGGHYPMTSQTSGGSQTTGGQVLSTHDGGNMAGGFGYGGAAVDASGGNTSGGGGGWYGGGASSWTGAAGGSGYIGSSQLKSIGGIVKHMTCYNCATSSDNATRTQSNTCASSHPTADCSKTGHGYARITLLAVSDEDCYIPDCPSGTAYSAKYGDCKPLASFTQIAQVTDFAYTGGEQTMNVPVDGIYKLEVWGAQGGNYDDGTNHAGGYGGYSVGVLRGSANEVLYVNVGGQGEGGLSGMLRGGYNGGGNANGSEQSGRYGASGGGATHIATVTGLLKDLSSYKNTGGTNISKEILIVAGAGSGPNSTGYDVDQGSANGGGYIGSAHTLRQCSPGGGSQTAGGIGGNPYNCDLGPANLNGGFGFAGGGPNGYLTETSGGGGGWYGGGGCLFAAGAGGSGYINSSNLISASGVTKHMTCYNCATSSDDATRTQTNTCANDNPTADCAKSGNGFARITRLEVP